MTTPHTLQEKTTAMEKAIRMAKEVHEAPERKVATSTWGNSSLQAEPTPQSALILTTAKQIYDWLTS